LARESPDDELLHSFLEGRESAFEQLMRRHEDRIFALALRITGNRADALDATQETFIALFRRASSFRGQSELGTWLYRIGINAARDVLRKRKRLPEPAEVASDAVEPPAADVHEAVALRIDVARALEGMPEDYREAVIMHDLGGAPYDEIARVTGVALGTVKSRISRGRRLLAERLEHPADRRASKDLR
jgi:RNA polymerase sigma-70 factor (ECF subfamily)